MCGEPRPSTCNLRLRPTNRGVIVFPISNFWTVNLYLVLHFRFPLELVVKVAVSICGVCSSELWYDSNLSIYSVSQGSDSGTTSETVNFLFRPYPCLHHSRHALLCLQVSMNVRLDLTRISIRSSLDFYSIPSMHRRSRSRIQNITSKYCITLIQN